MFIFVLASTLVAVRFRNFCNVTKHLKILLTQFSLNVQKNEMNLYERRGRDCFSKCSFHSTRYTSLYMTTEVVFYHK